MDTLNRDQRRQQERQQKKLNSETIRLEYSVDPGLLQVYGIIIQAQLTITPSYAEALIAEGRVPPKPVNCRFLIDTGARTSMVKHEFAERAGLKLINSDTPIHGVGVDASGKTYMGRINFFTQSSLVHGVVHGIHVDARILSGELSNQGNSKLVDGLIGRDVLNFFDLKFSTKFGKVVLTYHRPNSSNLKAT